MSPLLIGGAALALLAYLKKQKEKPDVQEEGLANVPKGTDTSVKSNESALARDVGIVVGGGVGVLSAIGGVVTATGGTIGGTLASIGSGLGSFAAAIGAPALVFVAIIVLIVVAAMVANFMNHGKDFVGSMRRLLPNGRAMVQFETQFLKMFAEANKIEVIGKQNMGTVFASDVVNDFRLELNIDEEDILLQGKRGIFQFEATPTETGRIKYGRREKSIVDPLAVQKILRALAIEYVIERGKYGAAYLKNWAPKIAFKEGFQYAPRDYWLYRLYDDNRDYPNIGGLANIPLLGGYTQKPLDTDYSKISPTKEQLIGVNTAPEYGPQVEAFLNSAKFVAFKEALEYIDRDNAIYFPWDANRYAVDVYNRLELSKPRFILTNTVLTLPYSEWGFKQDGQPVHLNVDIIQIKDGNFSAWYHTKA